MAEIDVLKAQIVRDSHSVPWGFRLQGGADFGQPLTIMRITAGSPAARIGLKSGDEVTEIGDVVTRNLSHDQASAVIAQYGQSIVLTVERRARGSVPTHPAINTSAASGQLPGQPYEMYDPNAQQLNPAYQVGPQTYHTASARPFESPSLPKAPPPPAPEPQPEFRPQPQNLPQHHVMKPENRQGLVRQSGTFNILASIMANEEPAAGVSALPRQRSAYREQQQREAQVARPGGPGGPGAQQAPGAPRVKVFMPQQYNTPLSMYSAQNVVETFQGQAEMQLEQLEQKHPDVISGAQRAVLEDDSTYRATSDF